MSWEAVWAGAGVARQFVQRLSELDPVELRQAVPPILDRDPYLSAWTNVQAALGNAPAGDREAFEPLLAELDARIEVLDLEPTMREAARRALRGLVSQPWLLTPESLTFVYEPFESVIPLASLGAVNPPPAQVSGETNVNQPDERLRPHPATRLAGPVVALDLPDLARALHAEPHPAKDGHRQVGLIHRGPLRLLLFTFEPGGRLVEHRAPGQVVIHCLRGELAVEAGAARHTLGGGEALVLEPDVPHSVEAAAASEMLLTVCLG